MSHGINVTVAWVPPARAAALTLWIAADSCRRLGLAWVPGPPSLSVVPALTLRLAVDSDSGDLKAEAQPRRRATDSVRLAA